MNHVPLANRFTKELDVTDYRARFYNEAGEAKDEHTLLNGYKKDGNYEKVQELSKGPARLGHAANLMWKQMNNLRDMELRIERDKSLTSEQRDAKLKVLEQKQIDISNNFHKMSNRKPATPD
jgi:acyl carrier protein phosphodiesterase